MDRERPSRLSVLPQGAASCATPQPVWLAPARRALPARWLRLAAVGRGVRAGSRARARAARCPPRGSRATGRGPSRPTTAAPEKGRTGSPRARRAPAAPRAPPAPPSFPSAGLCPAGTHTEARRVADVAALRSSVGSGVDDDWMARCVVLASGTYATGDRGDGTPAGVADAKQRWAWANNGIYRTDSSRRAKIAHRFPTRSWRPPHRLLTTGEYR